MMRNVLVLEDDEDLLYTVRSALQDAGDMVQTSPNVEMALHIIGHGQKGRIILFDYHFPAGTAKELMQALAANSSLRARFALILMTGSDLSHDDETQALIRLLEVRQLPKPFLIEDLFAAIDAAEAELEARTKGA
jgi:CheY-like chemotaxis protein